MLVQNFSYLTVLRLFNMFLPLIIFPYLIAVLGKELYGLVVFAQSLIGYLLILVNFGFNISATRLISLYRDNSEKLSEIVSSVLQLKAVFLGISFIILFFLIHFIDAANGYTALFYLTMWVCVQDVLFPIWYFQGIERMKFITYITLLTRILFLGLIFIYVKSEEDYLLVPLINGFGALLAGFLSIYQIFIVNKVNFRLQPMRVIRMYLADSFSIFISNVSTSIYVNTNKVVVGAFLGMSDVAYYDLAEKITNVFRIPQGILSQTLFPRISKDKNLTFVKKVFYLSLVMNLCFLLGIIILGDTLVVLLGGEELIDAILALNILALTIPIVGMSNMFGMQILIPFGYNRIFTKVIMASSLFYLLIMTTMWAFEAFTLTRVAWGTITTEAFVTLVMFVFIKKLNLWN